MNDSQYFMWQIIIILFEKTLPHVKEAIILCETPITADFYFNTIYYHLILMKNVLLK